MPPTTVFSRLLMFDGLAVEPSPIDPAGDGLVATPSRPSGVVSSTSASRVSAATSPFAPASVAETLVLEPWPFAFLNKLQQTILDVDHIFRRKLPEVAHVSHSSVDPHQTLLDVVGLHPSSVDYFQRFTQTADQLYNEIRLSQGEDAATWMVGLHRQLVKVMLGFLGYDQTIEVPILEQIFDDHARPTRGAVIDSVAASETMPIRGYSADGRNYLEWLATSPFDTIRREDFGGERKPSALLYLLARHGLLRAYWGSSISMLAEKNLIDVRAVRREPVFYGVSAELDGTSPWLPLITTEPQVTGDSTTTMAEYLDHAAAHNLAGAGRLREVRDALSVLSTASTASLERLFSEHVDLCSYRLDAWKLGLVPSPARENAREAQPRRLHWRVWFARRCSGRGEDSRTSHSAGRSF